MSCWRLESFAALVLSYPNGSVVLLPWRQCEHRKKHDSRLAHDVLLADLFGGLHEAEDKNLQGFKESSPLRLQWEVRQHANQDTETGKWFSKMLQK